MSKLKALPLDTALSWSNYTKLEQIPITNDFVVDDNGVRWLNNKKEILVCGPISFVSIARDRKFDIEYIEVSFLDLSESKPKIENVQMETYKYFEKDGLAYLRKRGFTISNEAKFKEFISTIKLNIDILTLRGIKTPVKRYYGSTQYGFEIVNGIPNFDNFIGVDTEIIPSEEYEYLDRAILKTKGTLEEQLEFYKEFMKESPCKTFIKQAFATAFVGIVRMFLANRDDMQKPIYYFAAPSSFGKQYLEKMIIGTFSNNTSIAPIASPTDTSPAAERRKKNRLGVFTYIDDDWSEFTDRPGGDEKLREKAYEQTNGSNTGRANSDGTLRKDNSTWECALSAFGEKADAVKKIKNGGDARIAIIECPTTAKQMAENDIMIFGPVDKKPTINKLQDKAYGHTGLLFLEKIKEYAKDNDITEEFMELSSKYRKDFKCKDKNASSYAILELSYNLAYKFGVIPEEWGPLTTQDNTDSFDRERTTTSEEEIYNLFRERILSQTNIYIPIDTKMTTANYEEKMEKNQTIRGRIQIKDMEDGRRLKFAVVPVDVVNRNIADIQKTYSYVNNPISTKMWLENEWLLPNNKGYAQHNCSNITRQYIKGESKLENCYKIVLEDLTPTDEERAEEEARKQKQLEKKQAEDRIKLQELKERLIPKNEGLIEIPNGIDELIG